MFGGYFGGNNSPGAAAAPMAPSPGAAAPMTLPPGAPLFSFPSDAPPPGALPPGDALEAGGAGVKRRKRTKKRGGKKRQKRTKKH